MRWFDLSIDEAIIDNHMLEEVWRDLTPQQRASAAKASAGVDIPDMQCQRRAYVFIEPAHRFVGVFDPATVDILTLLNCALLNADHISIYVLENAKVMDFYGVKQ